MPFLVFEGIDGSGKSTLFKRLAQVLEEQGHSVRLTREPGGTPLGEELRHLVLRPDHEVPVPRSEALLYAAIRAQHVEKVIKPALAEGKWVLCDRFTASTVAFQGGGRHISADEINWLNFFATSGLTPDLTILLDLPVEESLKRLTQRYGSAQEGPDRFEQEAFEFHNSVRVSYLNQAQQNTTKWLVLNAEHSPEKLFTDLIAVLRNKQWLA